jgi:uncharacterized damage-inducible protein DinB
MSVDRFKQFAAYNKWANARLYAAALDLSEQSYRLHIGVFFGGLHGTLNHLLLTDRLWLNEPPRDCRRLFCLSHAATAVSATLA